MNFAYRLKSISKVKSSIVLTVVTEFFAAEFAYNKPIRIIINRKDTFMYFDTQKERISCYYFAVVFFHFVILVQRIFHQSRCTETASNDGLHTYNILPYQPGAHEAVYLHCHSRLVTPQRGRL